MTNPDQGNFLTFLSCCIFIIAFSFCHCRWYLKWQTTYCSYYCPIIVIKIGYARMRLIASEDNDEN